MFDHAFKFNLTIRCALFVFVATSCSAGVKRGIEEAHLPAPVPPASHSNRLVPVDLTVDIEAAATHATMSPVTQRGDLQTRMMKPPNASSALRVAVISDINSSYGSTDYAPDVSAAIEWLCNVARPDLVLGTGDMVAGMREGLDYPAMWRSFHQTVTTPLEECGLPFAPSPGNHDAARAPRFDTEREEFVSQWIDRRPDVAFDDDEAWPLRYAFRANSPASPTFISLDLTTPRRLPPSDIDWLDRQLHAAPGRAIVYGHVPIVPIAQGRQSEASHDPALISVLQKHHVALFLHGHHHAYFPHITDQIPTVAMPNLGSGPRAWLGTTDVGGPGLVLLTITADAIQWQAYHAPNFDVWNVDSLPAVLPTDDGEIRRWDGSEAAAVQEVNLVNSAI